ncbi:hypothetical protein M514_09585 [Trichuris suis]|uniref:Phosphatidic acid phosphatase type 2/haloperoxidase domain-containing protein n=1 Tax=Trichuris suis TaxID=68888 RepID=A0A085LX64_9BILA|nr:hypothetical protein M513_09585 [Trichuris suis]KFD64224.1 hypothetical protein M514_09585 [Trichuris suis]KHJ47788.1 PAP2 family protein [Trichuris suis]
MDSVAASRRSKFGMHLAAEKITKRHVLKIVLDLMIIAAISVPIIVLHAVVWPYRRGFYCDDVSIRYPYKESTVSGTHLGLIAFPLPLLIITVVEWFRITYYERRRYNETIIATKLSSGNAYALVVRLYFFFGYFLCGAAANEFSTDLGKFIIGRLRPNFLDVCRPNVGYTICSDHIYISNFTCSSNDLYRIKDARLSFPSGHSSWSAYTMLFTVIYLQARLKWRVGSELVKPFIQFLLLCIAFAVALSRISDFKHHWSDVLAGSFLGSLIAILLTAYVMKIFELEGKHFAQFFKEHLPAQEMVTLNEPKAMASP